jgi:hypothetical protein
MPVRGIRRASLLGGASGREQRSHPRLVPRPRRFEQFGCLADIHPCLPLRYRLTLRDLGEMFLQRGIVFSHEAVRDWEAKLAPALADELRQRRRGKGGAGCRRWHVDETSYKGPYVKRVSIQYWSSSSPFPPCWPR